ncbi:hypothetical protein C8E97_4116 [Saccharothrix australiensis]|uniref:Uncharacterized protein n=1 Tax=Saccharothrix australiensis TaxID=2072 RepID=A0A495W6L7_9PSEU|nr:hypothetical protein C8E97_4116 [Saccharothrix australiensis]
MILISVSDEVTGYPAVTGRGTAQRRARPRTAGVGRFATGG